MCVLCYNTFTRTDTLKRHFARCAALRGNPYGHSHLSHPEARVKKSAVAQQKPVGTKSDVVVETKKKSKSGCHKCRLRQVSNEPTWRGLSMSGSQTPREPVRMEPAL